MRQVSKIVAGVLLAVSAATVFPMIAWAGSLTPTHHGTVCHHEFPPHSAPAPRNHQCCVSGHQWAVPGSPLLLRPVATLAVHQQMLDRAAASLSHDAPVVLFHSPPVRTSLRI